MTLMIRALIVSLLLITCCGWRAKGFLAVDSLRCRQHATASSTSGHSWGTVVVAQTSSSGSSAGDSDGEDSASAEGREMAAAFYKQLRDRQESDPATTSRETLTPSNKETELPSFFDTSNLDGNQSKPRTKFTGKSLFSAEEQEATPANRRERQQEFNLAGNFDRTLPLQAALVLASLVFVTYVGLTGGITDGSDRYFPDDEMDDVVIQNIEQIRTDSNNFQGTSNEDVWL